MMKTLYSLILLLTTAICAHGLPYTTYAPSSRLASGRWVRVSVSATSMYTISAATLRSYGFSDPSKVHVFGYGGARIPDLLNADTYIDDLPLAPQMATKNGLTFYGVGTEGWSLTQDGWWDYQANPFSLEGYYFLSDIDCDDYQIPIEGIDPDGRSFTSTYVCGIYHEKDLSSPGQSGHLLVGEDFRFTPSQTLNLNLPGRIEGTPVWMQTRFFANSTSDTNLSFSANGTALPSSSTDRIRGIGAESDTYGNVTTTAKTFDLQGQKLALGIQLKGSGAINQANLDNVVVNYTKQLVADKLPLTFASDAQALQLASAPEGLVVWDVTNAQHPVQMKVQNGRFINSYNGMRRYVAFQPDGASYNSVAKGGTVSNQDLHSLPVADMVIVTAKPWKDYAEQVAQLHRNDKTHPLTVHVIDQEQIFNEFGSGCADVGAIRRMCKMFYDRNQAEAPSDTTPRFRYVMLFGRPTYDQRHITAANRNTVSVPIWATEVGTNMSSSYSTDDYIALLDDESGLKFGTDEMRVAVGRVSCRDERQARQFVNVLTNYLTSPIPGEWRNQIMLLADDQDAGQHMDQTEVMEANILQSSQDLFFQKVYLDSYELIGGRYTNARDRMFRLLDSGVIWWNWVGHGARQSLSHEHQLTATDLTQLYLRRPTVFYGATCTFGVMDRDDQGGTESLVLEEAGGCVAAIAPQRPVYISQNGVMTANMGRELFDRGEDGYYRTLGEVLQRVKNRTRNDANKRRFVLLGDPAMRLGVPSNRIFLERIDSVYVNEENQVTIPARHKAVFEGFIADGKGSLLTDFNGSISLTLYDAEYSTTSNGRSTDDNAGKQVTFEQQGARLSAATDSVRNGRFKLTVSVPAEISDNFRPGAANMYAMSNDGVEAMGCNREFYLYGFDAETPADKQPPVIEYFYLNHPTFASGDVVNESPMVIARVSDDVAINLSTAGIGHEMTLRLDNNVSMSDVAQYFTNSVDGGAITYPLQSLAEGPHSLTLKVWDTDGNATSETIDFVVHAGETPKIYDVYSDANPASIQANFYVNHNRPDAMLTVKIEVFSIGGRLEWSDTQTGRADMFLSSPLTWDLTDASGHRVPRGIYLYRTTIVSGDGQETKPVTKRIAVTAG